MSDDTAHTGFCDTAVTHCFCPEYAALNRLCPLGFEPGQEAIILIDDPTARGRKSPVICRQMIGSGREFWLGLVLIETSTRRWRWSYLWIDESTGDDESKTDESSPVELVIPTSVEQIRLAGRADLPLKITRDRSTLQLPGRDGVETNERNREKMHPPQLPASDIAKIDELWPKLVEMARSGPTEENPSRDTIEEAIKQVYPTATMAPEFDEELRELMDRLTSSLRVTGSESGFAALSTQLSAEQLDKLRAAGVELTLVGTLPT